ncbi:MAG: DUF2017 family protein [Actinomycetota bacterium]
MAGFASSAGGISVRLEPHERGLLAELVHEMRTLLEADVPPEDEVLQRLFPRAYEEDADEDAYRELIGGQLQDHKIAALLAIQRHLEQDPSAPTLELDGEDLDAWLAWLTDVRLAIGTRLGITEEKMEVEVDPDDPDSAALSVLHWLGWLQEGSLQAMSEGEPR